MLVKTGDILRRKGIFYEVLIADDNIFVIAQMRFNKEYGVWSTLCDKLEAYSNLENINTLEQLGFTKLDK